MVSQAGLTPEYLNFPEQFCSSFLHNQDYSVTLDRDAKYTQSFDRNLEPPAQ
jgi:hypothetical protein